MERQKRVAAIHDISGFGKCSLTVALPIISAAGIEACAMPTAVLSTHTGGIEGFTYRDLTEDMIPFAKHWKSVGVELDAIYTGFLGSFEQIDIVSWIFDEFKTEGNIILVDPVMADNGEMYKIFDKSFAAGMKKLCSKADIVVPNITEACFMLGMPYEEPPYTKEYIEKLLFALCELGPKKAVLTGVCFGEGDLGAACLDKDGKTVEYAFSKRIQGYYHGTGDVFASALLSAVLCGRALAPAAQIAVDFTAESINRTHEAKTDIRFGVNFEASLPGMIKALGLI